MATPAELPVVHLYPALGPDAAAHLDARLPGTEIVLLANDDEFGAALPTMEALCCFRPPRGRWAEAPNLRLVQLAATGVDGVLPAPDLPDDVFLCRAEGIHLPQMPEFVLGMVLGVHLDIPGFVRQQQAKEWKWITHAPLAGQRAVVVGTGTIGRAIAAQLAAVGIIVDGVSRSGAPVDGFRSVVTTDRRAEVLDGAEIVVLVVPLTDDSRGMFGSAEIDLLAPGALLVDVSRGEVADLGAVRAALGDGRLRGAAIDVFPTEPLPADDPAWETDNLLVTPHAAALTPDYLVRIADLYVEAILAVRAGRAPDHLVDRDRGY